MQNRIAACLLSLAAGLLLTAPLAASPERGGQAGEYRGEEIRLPVRGMTMDNVVDVFGEPRRRIPPVGDPPISRWEYDGFTVYFEYRWVLHSVVHP